MTKKKVNKDRRNFLKTVTVAGACSLLGNRGVQTSMAATKAEQTTKNQKYPQIPRRLLGKTGVSVPILSHGLMYNVVDNQIVLRRSLMWGVSHWDTAHMYGNGNSELGVGKFLKAKPHERKNLFIVSKASNASSIEEVEERLQSSLKRMNTSYNDLYYGVHGLSDPDELTDELKAWAINAKKRGVIRYFGFSTHSNMAECLDRASELNWIDAIMTSYNFRLMADEKLGSAIDRCHKANIGLIAMKTQAQSVWRSDDSKLTEHFLASGYTEGQAKLKVVLEDKRFAAVCITMPSVALLVSNVAASLDKVKLSQTDKSVLDDYSYAHSTSYCAGCGNICNQTAGAPISDIMRYLMYHNSYGDREKARVLFSQIPKRIQNQLTSLDFSEVERLCPQQLPVGQLVKEAVELLC